MGAKRLPRKVIDEQGPRRRVHGEWLGHTPVPGEPLLLYIHGSGYVGCSPGTHRALVSELSRRLERPAFSMTYRRAPEYRFPAAQDDALNAFLWLLNQGHLSSNIIVAGDSAGGHLALGLCAQLRELGIAQPRAIIGFSALVDPTWQAIEQHPVASDPVVTLETLRKLVGLYMGTADPTDPRFAVATAVGPDLPPILLQAGANELLSADSAYYGRALRAAGGSCEVQIWPGMFHVFQLGYHTLPEARAALDRVEVFVDAIEARTRQNAG
ncbi:alpha/beta hydrolase [Nocardia sp. NPDC020380]|uniref:alpha/beta hydrolase n=1 Tax=Nocardia sp. NPDC020380 TaxID=3364309 RepID=UPI003788D7F8